MADQRATAPPDRELGSSEVVQFWDRRHAAAGEGASGGFISLGEAGNRALYLVRLGQLVTLAGGSAPTAPLEVLDAGCGKGIFARGLAECGYRVVGFDPSEQAVAVCRDKAGPHEEYVVNTMVGFPGHRMFDLVYSIDVMFHIMDDDEWLASVQRLCRLVRLGGRVALVDTDQPQGRRWATYQKTRPAAAYHEVYRANGIQPLGMQRCGPPGYPNVFHIGRRVS